MSMVVYWMMIFWLKQSDTCVNGSLLNDDILIKTKWYLCHWWFIDDTLIKRNTCVNGGLLNDDILILLEIKTKWYLCQWWFIEWWLWLKQSNTWKLKQSDTWQMCQ